MIEDILTARELQVAKLIAVGAKNREIAEMLSISTKTVDSHRMHALKKLGVRNNVELTRMMIRAGITDVHEQYEMRGLEANA